MMRKKKRNKVDVGYTLFIFAVFLPIILREWIVPIPDFWFRIIYFPLLAFAIIFWIFYSFRDRKHSNSFFSRSFWSFKNTPREKTLDERYAEMLENEEYDDDDVSENAAQ
jgi:hypothetical protein